MADEVIEASVVDDTLEETVDGVPVLGDVGPVARSSPAMLPAVQAAVAAATGFVAGAATIVLVRRHTARKVAHSQRQLDGRRRVGEMVLVGTRTFLVDVHLIAKPGE
jgi:hypothetical protein